MILTLDKLSELCEQKILNTNIWLAHAEAHSKLTRAGKSDCATKVLTSFIDSWNNIKLDIEPFEGLLTLNTDHKKAKAFSNLIHLIHLVVFTQDEYGGRVSPKQEQICEFASEVLSLNWSYRVPFEEFNDVLQKYIQLTLKFAKSKDSSIFHFPEYDETNAQFRKAYEQFKKDSRFEEEFNRY